MLRIRIRAATTTATLRIKAADSERSIVTAVIEDLKSYGVCQDEVRPHRSRWSPR